MCRSRVRRKVTALPIMTQTSLLLWPRSDKGRSLGTAESLERTSHPQHAATRLIRLPMRNAQFAIGTRRSEALDTRSPARHFSRERCCPVDSAPRSPQRNPQDAVTTCHETCSPETIRSFRPARKALSVTERDGWLYLHTVEVAGSNPAAPTIKSPENKPFWISAVCGLRRDTTGVVHRRNPHGVHRL
jgi:hypothetical protein